MNLNLTGHLSLSVEPSNAATESTSANVDVDVDVDVDDTTLLAPYLVKVTEELVKKYANNIDDAADWNANKSAFDTRSNISTSAVLSSGGNINGNGNINAAAADDDDDDNDGDTNDDVPELEECRHIIGNRIGAIRINITQGTNGWYLFCQFTITQVTDINRSAYDGYQSDSSEVDHLEDPVTGPAQ